jgi:hypothetical protein
MNRIHYIQVEKCHNEADYFVQLTYTNKKERKVRTIVGSKSVWNHLVKTFK